MTLTKAEVKTRAGPSQTSDAADDWHRRGVGLVAGDDVGAGEEERDGGGEEGQAEEGDEKTGGGNNHRNPDGRRFKRNKLFLISFWKDGTFYGRMEQV